MMETDRFLIIPEDTFVWNLKAAKAKLENMRDLTGDKLKLERVYPKHLVPSHMYDRVAAADDSAHIALWFGVDRDDNSGPSCFAWFALQKEGEELTVRVAITNKYITRLGEQLQIPGSLDDRFAGAFTYLVAGEGSEDTRKILSGVLNDLDVHNLRGLSSTNQPA